MSHPSERTIGVFGNSRGGTTATIGLVHLLGVPLYSTRLSLDDAQLEHIVSARRGDPRNIIARRDEEHDVWGFKAPALLEHAPMLQKHLRNPYYIYVTRDPISSLSHENEIFEYTDVHFKDAIQRADRQWEAIGNTTCPFIVVSYERLIKNPNAIIRQIADFIGLPFSHQAVDFINAKKGYRKMDEFLKDYGMGI